MDPHPCQRSWHFSQETEEQGGEKGLFPGEETSADVQKDKELAVGRSKWLEGVDRGKEGLWVGERCGQSTLSFRTLERTQISF